MVAVDKFKGSMTAPEAARAIAGGIRQVLPDAEVLEMPLSDGGEGFLDCMSALKGGSVRTTTITGPRGGRVAARFGISADGRVGIIESAEAVGWRNVASEHRDPLRSTSRGLGELMLAAVDHGCRRLLVGVGGTLTNDGGSGLGLALGARLLDGDGHELDPTPLGLEQLAKVDLSGLDERLAGTEIVAACDVDNPLLGPNGASAVYGPQKGATPEQVERLEAALTRLAINVEAALAAVGGTVRPGLAELPGAGAGGGIGFGLAAFAGAKLVRGAELMLTEADAEELFAHADLVVTGEGRLDQTTMRGKLPAAVAVTAQRARARLITAICGESHLTFAEQKALGFDNVLTLVDGTVSLSEAMADAAQLAERAGRRLARLVLSS